MTSVTDSRASYCCPVRSTAPAVPIQSAPTEPARLQAQQTVLPDYPRWWQMPRTLRDAACGFVASGAMATATVMTGLLAAEAERSLEHRLESPPLTFLSFVFGVVTVVSACLTDRVVRSTYASERDDIRARRAADPTPTTSTHDAAVSLDPDEITV